MMQRVEHFEIATYGCLQEFAEVLENPEIKNLLHESLKEEHKADSALTKLAKGGLFSKGINAEATHNSKISISNPHTLCGFFLYPKRFKNIVDKIRDHF